MNDLKEMTRFKLVDSAEITYVQFDNKFTLFSMNSLLLLPDILKNSALLAKNQQLIFIYE